MQTILQKYWLIWGCFVIVFLLSSCNTTRYVEPDKYLLKGSVKVKGNENLDSDKVFSTIKMKPNRRMLLPKTFLYMHNLGRIMDEDMPNFKRWFHKRESRKALYNRLTNWLKNDFGEAPIVVEREAIQKDSMNLHNLYFANGYFYPNIAYQIDTINNSLEQQKANVTFLIEEGKAYKIAELDWDVKDPEIASWCQNTAKDSYLHIGDNYRHDRFAAERVRISNIMRNRGFFHFSPKMVSFSIDTFKVAPQGILPEPNTKWLSVTVNIDKDLAPYTIGEVRVKISAFSDGPEAFFATFRGDRPGQRTALNLTEKQLSDTLPLTFIVSRSLISRLNYNFLAKRISLQEGTYYSQKKAQETQKRLQELGMLKYVILTYEFDEARSQIYVNIEMQMANRYQFKGGFEVFTNDIRAASSIPSLGLNIGFKNRNTFHRSELFELELGGEVGFYNVDEASVLENLFFEAHARSNISFPRFLLPFRFNQLNLSRYAPATDLALSGRVERRREYQRLAVGGNISYKWTHTPYTPYLENSRFSPVNIEIIDISILDSSFQDLIQSLPIIIQNDYNRRFSSRFSYSYTHSDYAITRKRPTHFLRITAELGGHLPFLLDKIGIGRDSSTLDNLIWNDLYYAPYAKLSAEGKYYVPLTDAATLVFRGFIGGSYPYPRSTASVPFESRFFSGGINSMRGWQSNTLGPGTLSLSSLIDSTNQDNNTTSLIAPGGEWKLEMNAELRVNVFSYLNMAVFTDAGNVWFNNRTALQDLDAQSVLSWENFRLGWDAGIGLRLDFDFLLVRLDVAKQLYAPDRGWVHNIFTDEDANANRIRRLQFNWGIGYPF